MKKIFLLLLILCFPVILNAQTIKVLDKTSLQPLPYVSIYTLEPQYSITTDHRGQADISPFNGHDSIHFRILGYQELILSYRQISENNFGVLLNEKIVQMEELVITAHRWEETQADIPNQITKITPREIQFQNPQTSADMIGFTGEVFVQKSQLGGGSPMIRGFSANSILLVVDGVRMNNAIYRSGNLQNVLNIDPNSLQSSEVLFGPGSVLYGSDALGGVINFQTKSPVLGDSANNIAFGSMYGRYSSANHEKTGHLELNLGSEKIGSYTSISYSDFDNLRTGNIRSPYNPDFGKREWYVDRLNGRDTVLRNPDANIQRGSAFNQFNALQKFRYKPSAFLDLEYGFYYSTTSDIPRYDRLIEVTRNGSPRNAQWYYGPQTWIMHSLNVNISHYTPFYDRTRITLAYQDYEESRHDRRFQSPWLRSQTEQVDALSANIDFKKEIGSRNELYYGLEAFSNFVRSSAEGFNIETNEREAALTRYPDGGSDVYSTAAYAQFVRHITEKLTFSAGSRYTWYTLSSRISDTAAFRFPFEELGLTTSAITGTTGLVYLPNEKWRLNFNAASGFRAPNVDDVAKVFDSEPGRVIVPNSNLGPEFSYTVEAGISRTFQKRYTISSTAYYTWVRNAIERRDFTWLGQDSIMYDGIMSQVTANVNVGQAYIAGFSVNLAAELNEYFTTLFTITYTEGLDQANQLPLRHIPPVFGRASLIFKHNRTRCEFFSHFSGWRYFHELPPEEQAKFHLYPPEGSPSWFTLNFRASYQITNQVQINAGLENILDHHYRPFASGISAPGRNLFAAVRVRF